MSFYCKFCNRSFKSKSSHTQHEKYHCLDNPNRQQIKLYTEHKKIECKVCGKLFDVANIKRHECSCGKSDNKRHVTHDGLNCEYCGKLCKNKNSLAQHELRCKENPDRKNFDSLSKYVLEETSTDKIVRYQKCHDTLRARIADGEICFDNRVFCKYKFGTYEGYHCDSSWELAFVIYNLDHNIEFVRNTERFPYEYNGKIHTYYPDFIVDNVYYEIKSYFDDKVFNKCRDFPKNKTLIVLDKDKMQPYLDYVINKYGKDFNTLYDRSSPSWLDLK